METLTKIIMCKKWRERKKKTEEKKTEKNNSRRIIVFVYLLPRGAPVYLSCAGLHSYGADWAQNVTQLTNKLHSFTHGKN